MSEIYPAGEWLIVVGGALYCPLCRRPLIEDMQLVANGKFCKCGQCSLEVDTTWEDYMGHFTIYAKFKFLFSQPRT